MHTGIITSWHWSIDMRVTERARGGGGNAGLGLHVHECIDVDEKIVKLQ